MRGENFIEVKVVATYLGEQICDHVQVLQASVIRTCTAFGDLHKGMRQLPAIYHGIPVLRITGLQGEIVIRAEADIPG